MWDEVLLSINLLFSLASLSVSIFKYFRYQTMNAVTDAIRTTKTRVRSEMLTLSPPAIRALAVGVGSLERL
jgi:hypothetical protein